MDRISINFTDLMCQTDQPTPTDQIGNSTKCLTDHCIVWYHLWYESLHFTMIVAIFKWGFDSSFELYPLLSLWPTLNALTSTIATRRIYSGVIKALTFLLGCGNLWWLRKKFSTKWFDDIANGITKLKPFTKPQNWEYYLKSNMQKCERTPDPKSAETKIKTWYFCTNCINGK